MYVFNITAMKCDTVDDFLGWFDLQIKCFVPSWAVGFVKCLRADPCVANFKHGKWIAVA